MKSEELKQTLDAKGRDELNVIARKLGIQKFRHNTKDELVERILKERRQYQVRKYLHISRWDRIYFHLFGWSSFASLVLALIPVVLGLLGYGVYRLQQDSKGSSPSVKVAWTPETLAPIAISPTPVASPSATQNLPRNVEVNRSKEQSNSDVNRAKSLYNQGKYEEAIAWCNKALAIDPQNSRAAILKARIEKTKAILRPNQ